jgi:hypothetical protein
VSRKTPKPRVSQTYRKRRRPIRRATDVRASLLGDALAIVYRHHSGQIRSHRFANKKSLLAFTAGSDLLIITNAKVSEFIED